MVGGRVNFALLVRAFCFVFLALALTLFFIRLVLPSQLDDVSPLMGCSEEELSLADIYFVVPKFDGVAISENGSWCENIKKRAFSSGSELGVGSWENRLAMHGVYHTYNEFGEVRSQEYFSEGVDIFRECFGVTPTRFKPGQLKWISENNFLLQDMEIDLFWNQVFHKVYHCGDTGRFPNWLIRVF